MPPTTARRSTTADEHFGYNGIGNHFGCVTDCELTTEKRDMTTPEQDSDADVPTALPDSGSFSRRLEKHLRAIYPGISSPQAILQRIQDVCNRYRTRISKREGPLWDQSDAVLITYGDNIQDGSRPTLDVLGQFLQEYGLQDLLPVIHLLPINPYTSDDGFSVVDYREIDASLGDWDNIDRLNDRFDLMLDLVLNHCSQANDWFQKFLARETPFIDYFIESDPAIDLSGVIRPRNLPLLSKKETAHGPRYVWTTFSDDQVDLNFGTPDVLLEFIDILLLFVSHGARIVRLDAIAYLWKEIGTSCIHLPETHEIVKLMRTILEEIAPQTLLLTETNVPHAENISYFGRGDEAQMVYQFSLPPLLIDAYIHEDATALETWLKSVCESPPGTTFFNFTASHDGIGVRPLEGLVPQANVDRIAERAISLGGKVGKKANLDGTESPYELNVTYLDMLLTGADTETLGIDRFLSSQAIMLAMKGIPGIYIHSLLGTRNDLDAVERSQIPRRINRRKFDRAEIEQELSQVDGVPARVFQRYQHLLSVRKNQAAFHPDASQVVLQTSNEHLLVFQRRNDLVEDQVVVVANFSSCRQTVDLTLLFDRPLELELISGKEIDPTQLEVAPFGIAWVGQK